jgi:peptide-methionine (S)-S-oxide reductase
MVVQLLTAAALLMVCSGSSSRGVAPGANPRLRQATFAAGCFWGVEAAFRKTPGVVATMAGYTGGNTPEPTYRDVALGHSGYAEAVLVTYDPSRISYAELLDVFWSCHDPTIEKSLSGEPGPHRSAIFFHNRAQEVVARQSMREVNESKVLHGPIVTEIVPARKFFPAEDFQQHYFEQHGGEGGSCHLGSIQVRTRLAARAATQRRSSGDIDLWSNTVEAAVPQL